MVDAVLPTFTILVSVIVLLPFYPHWRAQNVAILTLIVWLSVGNLVTFVNRIVWLRDASNKAPVWCDISVKLMSLTSMGIPCAVYCVSRKLQRITSPNFRPSSSNRTGRFLREIGLCAGLPVLYSISTIIDQGHRFNIIEGKGCQPSIYLSPVTVVIDLGMPLFVSALSIVHSCVALRNFIKRKSEMDAVLENSKSGMNVPKFLRAISYTIADLAINFPLLLTSFIMQLHHGNMKPYISWSFVHAEFNRVAQYRLSDLHSDDGKRFLTLCDITAWMLCTSGILFFALFGLSLDARAHYIHCFYSIGHGFKSVFRSQQRSVESTNEDYGNEKGITVNELPELPYENLMETCEAPSRTSSYRHENELEQCSLGSTKTT